MKSLECEKNLKSNTLGYTFGEILPCLLQQKVSNLNSLYITDEDWTIVITLELNFSTKME